MALKPFTLLVFVVVCCSAFSQSPAGGDLEDARHKKNIKYKLSFTLDVKGRVDTFQMRVPVPVTIPMRQTVTNLTFSPQPDSFFTVNNNSYVQYNFANLHKDVDVTMAADVSIYKYIANQTDAPDTNLSAYLAPEQYIECNSPEIKTIAAQLRQRTEIETVIKTFDYVKERVTYKITPSVGAEGVLENGEGKCMDFALLFIALLRANQIPAKYVGGIVLTNDPHPFHAWTEVYFRRQGWIRFDPTANISTITRNGNRYTMDIQNQYIVLEEGRNNHVLHGAMAAFRHTPFTHGSVKVRFKPDLFAMY